MRKALGAGLFMAVALVLELRFMRIEASTAAGKAVFFLLFNLMLLALFFLVVFVGENIAGLFRERRQRALGYRFKTRVVSFFVVIASIPAALLFLVASGLGTNYIERIFTPEFRRPIESSVEVAKTLYEMERSRTLQYAKAVRSGFAAPADYGVFRIKEMPEDASEAVRAAFAGRAGTEVLSGEAGDTVRAALPDGEGGAIVVESAIPPEITKNVEDIKTAYANYIKLESWVFPLQLNYLLMLGFITLTIVVASLWFSLRIARWITEPVRLLASATEEVAAGNLSVSIGSERKDEMGRLIESFNRMVGQLREGKQSLEAAYSEADKRRLTTENILESVQSGVISLDAKGNVQTINPSACRILRLKAGEVLGGFYTGMLAGIASEELMSLIRGINIKTFKSLDKEVWVSVEGRKILLRVFMTGLRDASGSYLGLLVVLDDLTGFVKAQRAIAWQEVARRMAHEIKNPLTPIKLSTERLLKKWLLKDEDFGQVMERSTETIIREVDGLRRLVDEFSRLGKMPKINKSPTDVGALMEDIAALYKGYGELNLKIIAPEEPLMALLDAEQIRRVIINLFDNALEAMGGKGNLVVKITPDAASNRLLLEVSDDGPGIRDEDKEKLFQPYFSTKKGGTGLGLAIADRIAADHGGNIAVRDNSPRGSVFTIELPLKEA